MPQTSYISWEDLLRKSALREGDLGILSPFEPETNNPKFDREWLEALHYDIACRTLRQLPDSDLMAFGSSAYRAVSVLNPYPLPRDTIRIVSVTIETGADFVPAVFVPIPSWFQTQNLDDEYSKRWTIMQGKLYFSGGASASVKTIYQPTLEQFRLNEPILPPGSEEDRLDWVHHMLQTINLLPQGRT